MFARNRQFLICLAVGGIALWFAALGRWYKPKKRLCDPLTALAKAVGLNSQTSNFTYSAGGSGKCLEGTVEVKATANNSRINLSVPSKNEEVTQLYIELTQAGSNLFTEAVGEPQEVNGPFEIYIKLCVPAEASLEVMVKTVQVLTHGGTLDHTYWDFTKG
ncbi:MAG: hypothetical protein CYPHOPRED_005239, partial [Cyphobasidiales sp. Tagirdzhanova-0007]